MPDKRLTLVTQSSDSVNPDGSTVTRTDGRTDGLTKKDSPTAESSPNASRAGGLKESSRSADETWVYHCMCSHGAVLYVGVARDVGRRLLQHRSDKPWWREVEGVIADRYPTRQQALAVERHSIQKGNRTHMHNRVHYTDGPRAPYRFEIRRNWTVDPVTGFATVNDYYQTSGPNHRLIFSWDAEYQEQVP